LDPKLKGPIPVKRLPTKGSILDEVNLTPEIREGTVTHAKVIRQLYKENVKAHRLRYVSEGKANTLAKNEWLKQQYINTKLRQRERDRQREIRKRERELWVEARSAAIQKRNRKEFYLSTVRRVSRERSTRQRREFQLEWLREERQRKWILKPEDITESLFDTEFETTGFWPDPTPFSIPKPVPPENLPPVLPDPTLPFEMETVAKVSDLVRPSDR